ncbi:MAG: hypothetical protein RL637_711 [Pseudomonadota bacterium]|jgi:hypothetical protein
MNSHQKPDSSSEQSENWNKTLHELDDLDEFLRTKELLQSHQVRQGYEGNKRKTVRYVRKGITAFISKADIFGGYQLFSFSRCIRVRVLDISSNGCLIACPEKLKIHRKIRLTLVFNSNRHFEISAIIVRKLAEDRKFYGIRFDHAHDELADYLLESDNEWSLR